MKGSSKFMMRFQIINKLNFCGIFVFFVEVMVFWEQKFVLWYYSYGISHNINKTIKSLYLKTEKNSNIC